MIEIDDGFFVNPWKVTVIKAVEKDRCALFVSGQSATDGGFLVNKAALEVASDIVEAMREDEEEEGE